MNATNTSRETLRATQPRKKQLTQSLQELHNQYEKRTCTSTYEVQNQSCQFYKRLNKRPDYLFFVLDGIIQY